MHQEDIGDAREPAKGLALIRTDRLVAQVPAGGYDWKRQEAQQ